MIPVTKTFLPPLNEYSKILEEPWNKQWITNRGALVNRLEEKMKSEYGLNYMFLTTNGTLPLQIAIKTLGLKGEIITTPFSYVATASSIKWENCTPVFVDIESDGLCMDPEKIEEVITEKTCAIMATHVFGNPCDVKAIEAIAKKHQLKVIYDAAHCFGVEYQGSSIFKFGDISTCSFHATKVFHTGEGGGLFCNSQNLNDQLFYHHNFGHNGKLSFHGLGINAKMSELQAAMGLAIWPYFSEIVEERKTLSLTYDENLNFEKLKGIEFRAGTKRNFAYYPILFNSEEELLHVEKELNQQEVQPRRYFYPALNTLDFLNPQKMPIAESVSARVMCLPLYYGLSNSDQMRIIQIINNSI